MCGRADRMGSIRVSTKTSDNPPWIRKAVPLSYVTSEGGGWNILFQLLIGQRFSNGRRFDVGQAALQLKTILRQLKMENCYPAVFPAVVNNFKF